MAYGISIPPASSASGPETSKPPEAQAGIAGSESAAQRSADSGFPAPPSSPTVHRDIVRLGRRRLPRESIDARPAVKPGRRDKAWTVFHGYRRYTDRLTRAFRVARGILCGLLSPSLLNFPAPDPQFLHLSSPAGIFQVPVLPSLAGHDRVCPSAERVANSSPDARLLARRCGLPDAFARVEQSSNSSGGLGFDFPPARAVRRRSGSPSYCRTRSAQAGRPGRGKGQKSVVATGEPLGLRTGFRLRVRQSLVTILQPRAARLDAFSCHAALAADHRRSNPSWRSRQSVLNFRPQYIPGG